MRFGESVGRFGEDLVRVLKGLRASWALFKVSGLLGGAVGSFGKDFVRVLKRLRASLALLKDSVLLFIISLKLYSGAFGCIVFLRHTDFRCFCFPAWRASGASPTSEAITSFLLSSLLHSFALPFVLLLARDLPLAVACFNGSKTISFLLLHASTTLICLRASRSLLRQV